MYLYSFFNLGTRGCGWSAQCPGKFIPVKGRRYPFSGGWVGRRAGLRGSGKFCLPPGFDPRTVQPPSESLYRLSFPANCKKGDKNKRRLQCFSLFHNLFCQHRTNHAQLASMPSEYQR